MPARQKQKAVGGRVDGGHPTHPTPTPPQPELIKMNTIEMQNVFQYIVILVWVKVWIVSFVRAICFSKDAPNRAEYNGF